MTTQIIGLPFVPHVDQAARPTLPLDYLKGIFADKFHSQLHNVKQSGMVKIMGYRYNFRPYLKRYVYKQYGSWHESFAPNKTTLRKVIIGRIDQILEAK